jgi:pyridoxamine 5'-phosphate oxidase
MPGAAKSPIPADPPVDPLRLFEAWYAEAVACSRIKYAHAACLSTTGLDDLPDARIVLAELHDASAFVFFTDAGSVKGRSLARSPEAALTFYWGPLDRQIRIRGVVEPGSEDLSDRCFNQRPRAAQITAWASRQSRERRAGELEERVEAFTERFADSDRVPRPPHWQAYRLVPRVLEFWLAKAGRLHDRLLYSRGSDGSWTTSRLEP